MYIHVLTAKNKDKNTKCITHDRKNKPFFSNNKKVYIH